VGIVRTETYHHQQAAEMVQMKRVTGEIGCSLSIVLCCAVLRCAALPLLCAALCCTVPYRLLDVSA